ncbi:MAG: glycosyltransferase N-terminal domain-containing protein [Bacteroidales bacterium]|jgi:3-deoxy-D-manno-octulosonic-acid transferase|nr:glycosyltransferase N-terminal domain-containing protein [Bacteroidales bacterium]
MRPFYTLGIQIYSLAVRLLSLWNPKAKQWIAGRENWRKQLPEINANDQWIWFHASSLGEFEQGRPLIESIKSAFPENKILLTFFSPSGFEIRKNYKQADKIMYLPTDTCRNARLFIEHFKFKAVFFIKYEFWFNYINRLSKARIPLYFIAVRFRADQHFFKAYGSWFRKHLRQVEHFFVQDENSKQLLGSIEINEVTVNGDPRFDRVAEIAKQAARFPEVEKFIGNRKALIAGSSWPPDEQLLIPFLADLPADYCFIIAPHDVSKSHIKQIENALPEKAQLYSKFADPFASRILIIDQIGILSQLYQYAQIAYIGGGFGKAIHNIQEAVTFGVPVLFGPNHQQFNEAVDLVNLGGAFSISNADELKTQLLKLINDEKYRRQAASVCKKYVEDQLGATAKIMDYLMLHWR